MKVASRGFLVGLFMTCMMFAPVLGQAEEWAPEGSITFQVGFGAGGSTDSLTRLLTANIEKTTGWNIIVENKPGGGGVAMLSGLMNKKPDGLTLGVGVNMPTITNLAERGDKLPFKIDSFDYIGTIAEGEVGLLAKADAPFNNFQEFLAFAKKDGASIGYDGVPLKMIYSAIGRETGLKFKLVTHKSGMETIQSIMGGHVDVGCASGAHVKYVESGDLKLIASMNKTPHSYAPEVKTLIDNGFNFFDFPFFYIAAPKGLPANVKAALVKAVDDSLKTDEVKDAIYNLMKVPPRNLGPEGTKKMLDEGVVDIAYLVEANKKK